MHDTHYVCRVQVISMIINTKITKKLHFTGINNVLFSFVSPTTHHIQVTCAWSLFVRRWRGHTFSDLTYLFLTLNLYQVFGLQNSTVPTFIPAISLICHSQMKGTNGIAQHTSQSKRLPREVKVGELGDYHQCSTNLFDAKHHQWPPPPSYTQPRSFCTAKCCKYLLVS